MAGGSPGSLGFPLELFVFVWTFCSRVLISYFSFKLEACSWESGSGFLL